MMTYHVQFLLLVVAGWVNRQWHVGAPVEDKGKLPLDGAPEISGLSRGETGSLQSMEISPSVAASLAAATQFCELSRYLFVSESETEVLEIVGVP